MWSTIGTCSFIRCNRLCFGYPSCPSTTRITNWSDRCTKCWYWRTTTRKTTDRCTWSWSWSRFRFESVLIIWLWVYKFTVIKLDIIFFHWIIWIIWNQNSLVVCVLNIAVGMAVTVVMVVTDMAIQVFTDHTMAGDIHTMDMDMVMDTRIVHSVNKYNY